MSAKREDPVVETAEDIESPEDRLIDAVTLAEQEALETLDHAGAAAADGVVKAQVEIVTFMARRVQEDLDIQRALLDCTSLDEVRRSLGRIDLHGLARDQSPSLSRTILTGFALCMM